MFWDLVRQSSDHLMMLSEGPTRLNVLSSRLGLPTRTISEVTEQFLLRARSHHERRSRRDAATDR